MTSPTTPTTPTMREALPFVIERRADTWVLDWSMKGGFGCRPATEPEVAMWQALAADDAARGTMREAFDAWCRRNGYPIDYATDAECGVEGGPVYSDSRTHAAWWAYREGRASRAAAPQSVEPVAYCDPVALAGLRGETCLAVTLYAAPTGYASKPLYLAPPSAPTDAERQAENERLREQLACVRQALPEALRDSVPSVAVATMTAGMEYDAALLRHALDALEYHRDQTRPIVLTDAAIAALRAHIATRPAPTKTKENGA